MAELFTYVKIGVPESSGKHYQLVHSGAECRCWRSPNLLCSSNCAAFAIVYEQADGTTTGKITDKVHMVRLMCCLDGNRLIDKVTDTKTTRS